MTSRDLRSQIQDLAELAHLALGVDDIEHLIPHLEATLAFFAELEAIDTDDIPALSHPINGFCVLRPDVPHRGDASPETLLASGSPEQTDPSHTYFIVPGSPR